MTDFVDFPKMARLSREIVITEKIDGTNAQIFIGEDGTIKTGSRTRWITPDNDNAGFAKWVQDNEEELLKLGPGRHFGEWWGKGIQRNYAQVIKRFSLFNTTRWTDDPNLPVCCGVVPELYRGMFCTNVIKGCIHKLEKEGSVAAPGFMDPEGIVVWHTAANIGFKKTIKHDELPKSKVA